MVCYACDASLAVGCVLPHRVQVLRLHPRVAVVVVPALSDNLAGLCLEHHEPDAQVAEIVVAVPLVLEVAPPVRLVDRDVRRRVHALRMRKRHSVDLRVVHRHIMC